MLVWVALCATAAADVYDDNPATASRGPGDAWVFARAIDGSILERHVVNGLWTDWASIGGSATSGPAAIAYDGGIRVYIRGPDGAYWENIYGTSGWGGWASLGGYFLSGPGVATRRGLNYIDIAGRGGDNAIWFESFVPGRGWSGFSSLGGALTSAPTIGSYQDGAFNLWARATNGAVAVRGWSGSAWSDWADYGGTTYGAPAAVSRTVGVENLYARGPSNAIYARSWSSSSSSGWSPWGLVDGRAVDSSPAAAGDGPSHEWLFARGGSGLLFKEWKAVSGWSGWSDFGPVAVPPPPAAPPPPPADGEVSLQAGVRCTPPGGRLRVGLTVRHAKGKPKPRVQRIVFYTRGKGRAIGTDHKAPFAVHLRINRPAGTRGRVYARVYYRRTKHGAVHRKTVSRRYTVCR